MSSGSQPSPTPPGPGEFLTVEQAVAQGMAMLKKAGVEAPRLNAEVLLMHAIGCDRAWLYAHATDPLRELWWIHYGRYLDQRMHGIPTQQITGIQEFYGRPFRVTPHVLIPRPETEHLIEAVLDLAKGGAWNPENESKKVVDIGTGSGCIAATLALELQGLAEPVFATDISEEAIRIATKNAQALEAQVTFTVADLAGDLETESCGLIASNPPYIALNDRDFLPREVRDHEPELALFAGPEGLDFYRRLIPESARLLVPGGWLVMEIGATQSEPVTEILRSEGGWTAIEVRNDLAGRPRVVQAQFRQY